MGNIISSDANFQAAEKIAMKHIISFKGKNKIRQNGLLSTETFISASREIDNILVWSDFKSNLLKNSYNSKLEFKLNFWFRLVINV